MSSTATRVTSMLIVASVAILGALAALRVYGYFMVESDLALASESARLSQAAAKQRNLGQRINLLAFDKSSDRNDLRDALTEFRLLHKSLSAGESLDKGSKRLIDSQDAGVAHILIAGEEIVSAEEPFNADAARQEIAQYVPAYDAALREVKRSLDAHLDERIAESQRTHKSVLVLGLAFLAVTIAIVAWPLRVRLRSALVQLVEAQRVAEERADELDVLRGELEKANNELKERHVRLRKAYDESSSANQFLMMASARFEDLFHGVPFACFSVDESGTVFEWNEAATALFGVSAHETIQKTVYGRFLSLDNDFVLKGLVAEAFKGHHIAGIEMEAECAEGKRQLLVSVFPLKAARKEPTAALIACADITAQKQAERDSRQANERVAAILDSIKDAFVTLDRDLVYRYVNNTAADWLGMPAQEVIGRRLEDVSPNLAGSDFVDRLRGVIEKRVAESFAYYFEGSKVWLEFRVYPSQEGASVFYNDVTVRKNDEETIRRQREQLEFAMLKLNENSVLLEQQQMELEEANRHLQELATTDGLTGLLNHRAMQDELLEAVRASGGKRAPVSVALLDVDHFKKFNDAFGHQSGDEVLRKVADLLERSVRIGDVVARYGGEEFCVILPKTTSEEALAVCERIRASVEGAPWEQRQVTVSIGLSTAVGVSDTQELLRQADQALYEAKASGRNRVCVFRAENYRCA